MDESRSLAELRAHFREGSTNAMPLAGMIAWGALGVLSFWLDAKTTANFALYIMVAILPLAFVIDRARGRNVFSGGDDPLTKLFLICIWMIGLSVPLVIIGANGSGNYDLIVLGMAILAGIIWIPYGWAADDPVGLRHAVGRGIGCYAAFALVPEPWRAAAICAVVVLAYIYSLLFMAETGPRASAKGV